MRTLRTMQKHSDLIGTAEASLILGKDRATLTRWVAEGKLKSHKLPGRTGAHLYSRTEVEKLAALIGEEKASA